MASEIGALSHIFRDIDVLVLSARRPSLAAPPRGPQVCRTFIGTIPHHRHIFLRNLVLTFFRCHRLKYWLPTSAGPLCGLVAVPFVLLLVRSSPAPYSIVHFPTHSFPVPPTRNHTTTRPSARVHHSYAQLVHGCLPRSSAARGDLVVFGYPFHRHEERALCAHTMSTGGIMRPLIITRRRKLRHGAWRAAARSKAVVKIADAIPDDAQSRSRRLRGAGERRKSIRKMPRPGVTRPARR